MVEETKLIAECGCNFSTVEEAKEMIGEASVAGVQYVKFQAYDEEAIRRLSAEVKEHLQKIMLTRSTAEELKKYAESFGLTWFATPTSEKRIDFLEDLGVTMYKVREKDSGNMAMLEKLRKLNKPMLVSSQHLPSSQNLMLLYDPLIYYLYCIPRYPTRLDELNLTMNIGAFRGFSCHYPGIAPPLFAAVLGAEWIECHVTLDKMRPDLDQSVSIDFNQLKQLQHLVTEFQEIRKTGLVTEQ